MSAKGSCQNINLISIIYAKYEIWEKEKIMYLALYERNLLILFAEDLITLFAWISRMLKTLRFLHKHVLSFSQTWQRYPILFNNHKVKGFEIVYM